MNKNSSQKWIKHLNLQRHPEGGWFAETYRAPEIIKFNHLPERFNSDHNISTAIYYLLESEDFSAFHRIKQDEIWHFYDGSVLNLHVIKDNGSYSKLILGNEILSNQFPQVVIKAGWLFGAEVGIKDSYTLTGCTVAPGFEFTDFEMPSREELLQKYPQHSSVITKLTRK